MSLTREDLVALVREVVRDTLAPPTIGKAQTPAVECDDGCSPRDVKLQKPDDAFEAQRVKDATPARLVQGRTGTRYLTSTAIDLRAEHAVALDAVASRIPDGFAQKLGCVELHTCCTSHNEFLLYPNLGRRLNDASKERLQREGTRGADVQVIAADGLAAWALTRQAETLLPALDHALRAQGFKTGKPLLVHLARIGVQDEIGVLLSAKSTVILLGERPGLGTGDSLSIYTAFAPCLEQDNAAKNCISNIRAMGLSVTDAAQGCAQLMRRTFDAGGGGIHLVQPQRDVVRRGSVA